MQRFSDIPPITLTREQKMSLRYGPLYRQLPPTTTLGGNWCSQVWSKTDAPFAKERARHEQAFSGYRKDFAQYVDRERRSSVAKPGDALALFSYATASHLAQAQENRYGRNYWTDRKTRYEIAWRLAESTHPSNAEFARLRYIYEAREMMPDKIEAAYSRLHLKWPHDEEIVRAHIFSLGNSRAIRDVAEGIRLAEALYASNPSFINLFARRSIYTDRFFHTCKADDAKKVVELSAEVDRRVAADSPVREGSRVILRQINYVLSHPEIDFTGHRKPHKADMRLPVP